MTDEDGSPEMSVYALGWIADGHYLAGDADRLLAAAQQLEELTRRLGEPENMVAIVQRAHACWHLLSGRPADAITAVQAALAIHTRVERELEATTAALLAEATLLSGDFSGAHAAAEHAIALSRRSLRAPYEAIGHSVVARALLRRDGAAARESAEAALANAAALIERSGAATLAPALCEWRAELAAVLGDEAARAALLQDARRGYAAIGAHGHVARLAREAGA